MIRKLGTLCKAVLISTIWSYAYFHIVHFIFLHIWKFDIIFTEYWVAFAKFWNSGGVINKFKEVMFIVALFAAIPIWLYTLIKLLKLKYINMLIYPINTYNNYITKKYGADSSRIMFKNLGTGKKDLTIEEMVQLKLKETERKGEKELEATKIRNIIQEKIRNKK
ncbi:MAG: hypothetical protein LBR70_03205 [Lactobacillaceae bacterium]|jgi:hypothetical protein|nr:hypothetical protein [Lactobacillaceae bacterium]